ncbi:MAG: exo-alpha-sialidase [Acidobacteriota bacterium]|nr:exo-alpha-sialidase [Acidobacteriota bacterium]
MTPRNVWFSKWSGRAGTVMSGPDWNLSVVGNHLEFTGNAASDFHYVLEDTRLRTDHTVAIYTGGPTRIFLDGYEVWSSPVSISAPINADYEGVVGNSNEQATRPATVGDPARTAKQEGDAGNVTYEDIARVVRENSPLPTPLVKFATMALNRADATRVRDLHEWSPHARFRVRGPAQYGAVFAASDQGEPTLTAFINEDGIQVDLPAASTTVECKGSWADGRWHDLTVAFVGGAIEVFVDGWLHGRAAGTGPRVDRFVIGQSLQGERLMGEVGRDAIYPALNDQQIAALADRAAIAQTPVFDRFPDGVFHRIPSLLRHSSGRLVAFADARHGLPNDSPNVTRIVSSFSDDEGETWSAPQEIAGYPSAPDNPISVTDPAYIEDAQGRIHLLFDLYPAGIGLLNSAPGHGHEGEDLLLVSRDGEEFLIPGGWSSKPTPVVTCSGEPTEFVAEAGPEILGEGDLSIVPTGHIAIVTSEDRGETWSRPRLLTSSVKDDWMTFLGIGPGSGIRLERGEHAGRLLVPVYFSNEDASQFSAAVIYSDDDGQTWARSASTNDDRTVDGERIHPRTFTNPAATMSESTVVELRDGTVVMFSRSQRPFVQRAVSRDGGLTWDGVTEETEVSEIFCQPSATVAGDFVYFANASRMLPYRGCGTLYRTPAADLCRMRGAGLSEQSGRAADLSERPERATDRSKQFERAANWQKLAINPRHHGYQSIVALEHGIGMLWERETEGVWFSFVPYELFSRS